MSQGDRIPSVISIWRNDHLAQYGCGAILAFWGFALVFTAIYFVEAAFGRDFVSPWFGIAIALVPTVVYLVYQSIRIVDVRRVFKEGERVTGRVASCSAHEHGKAVLIEFNWQGELYSFGHIITSRRKADFVSTDQPIDLVVDTKDPRKAFVDLRTTR